MLGDAKEVMQVARNPGESEHLRALAGAFAEVERQQRQMLRAHAEVLDVDPDEAGIEEPAAVEDRIEEICDAISARFAGNPWETWVQHVAPDELDGEAAEEWAGADPEEWADEREAIVENWRADDEIATDEFADEELVDADLSSRFGVDREAFEEYVIGYNPGRLLQTLLAGEFEGTTEGIEALTEEVAE